MYRIQCVRCTKSAEERAFRCTCGAQLEVIPNLQGVRFEGRGVERYRSLLPVLRLVSLGEGATPLVQSEHLGKQLGIDLYFKLESSNPTGSFKDRGSSVEVAKALELGYTEGICASTGNMGASVAAYCARAGIRLTVVVPGKHSDPKFEQIQSHGAKLVRVHGGFTIAARLAERKRKGFLFGDYLYRREGTKTIAYELAEAGNWDTIVLPIGNGMLLSSMWKGYRELESIGRTNGIPHFLGVQAAGCQPLVQAFTGKAPGKGGHTIASAIACSVPWDGTLALRALRDSKGSALAVSDQAIMRARKMLAEEEGIYAEPGAAAAFAGLLAEKSKFQRKRVVCVITGHGLKGMG